MALMRMSEEELTLKQSECEQSWLWTRTVPREACKQRQVTKETTWHAPGSILAPSHAKSLQSAAGCRCMDIVAGSREYTSSSNTPCGISRGFE
jgi:hypothetical protein